MVCGSFFFFFCYGVIVFHLWYCYVYSQRLLVHWRFCETKLLYLKCLFYSLAQPCFNWLVRLLSAALFGATKLYIFLSAFLGLVFYMLSLWNRIYDFVVSFLLFAYEWVAWTLRKHWKFFLMNIQCGKLVCKYCNLFFLIGNIYFQNNLLQLSLFYSAVELENT